MEFYQRRACRRLMASGFDFPMSRFQTTHAVIKVGLGVFFAIFVMLPYLVDVAYPGDLSPSHFAQEFVGDGEELDSSDGKSHLTASPDQWYQVGLSQAALKTSQCWLLFHAHTSASPHALLLASLTTSRPPPTVSVRSRR